MSPFQHQRDASVETCRFEASSISLGIRTFLKVYTLLKLQHAQKSIPPSSLDQKHHRMIQKERKKVEKLGIEPRTFSSRFLGGLNAKETLMHVNF